MTVAPGNALGNRLGTPVRSLTAESALELLAAIFAAGEAIAENGESDRRALSASARSTVIRLRFVWMRSGWHDVVAMERRRLAWFVSLPLVAVGSLLAHSASYRLVAPHEHERGPLLADTGHGYLAAWGSLLLAVLLAVVLLGLVVLAIEGARGSPRPRASTWPFALLPLLGFAVQEHLERLIHDGGFPLGTAAEPTFLVGVLLQLPFALAALLLARVLVRAACVVGSALGAERESPPTPPRLVAVPVEAAVPRPPILALGYAGRAPPFLLAG